MFTPITLLDKRTTTQEQAMLKMQEVKDACEKYELGDHPYDCWDRVQCKFSEQIAHLESDVSDLDECTRDSRVHVLTFVNFFIEQFNRAVESHLRWVAKPKTTLRVHSKSQGAMKGKWGTIQVPTDELHIYTSTFDEEGIEYEVL